MRRSAGSLEHGPVGDEHRPPGPWPWVRPVASTSTSRGRGRPGPVYHPRRTGVRQEEEHRMRAGRGAGVVLALALGACRSSSGDAADAGLVVDASTLRCETLLPADVREVVLPGFTLQEERPCPTCGPLCAFRSAAEPEVRVSLAFDCRTHYAGADADTLLAPALKAGGTELAGMGRAAARRSPVPGMLQVMAWDDDTPCALIVTWLGGDTERALDVTRTALRTTTPGSLMGPPSTLTDPRPTTVPSDVPPADAPDAGAPTPL